VRRLALPGPCSNSAFFGYAVAPFSGENTLQQTPPVDAGARAAEVAGPPAAGTGFAWLDAAWSAGIIAAAVVAGLIIHWIVFMILRRIAARAPGKLAPATVRYARRPMALILPLVLVQGVLAALVLPPTWAEGLRHALSLALIAGAAWLLISMSRLIEDLVGLKYRMDVADNLEARSVTTQVRVLRRTAAALVIIVAAAVMLMTFPRVKELGASLLASAGLAGLAVGFAARPVLQNLIAGVQIALTQPIRIDDVVIVHGEFGWIEEIATTFVIIRVWDQRRLVVPLNFFVENTFENWTRKSADLLGAVMLFVDYNVPVDELREELKRIVEGSGKWDGRVCGLQVVDTLEHSVKLRALVSAPSAPAAWDMRCLVREKLIAYLQEKHPGSLPRVRTQIGQAPDAEPMLLRMTPEGT